MKHPISKQTCAVVRCYWVLNSHCKDEIKVNLEKRFCSCRRQQRMHNQTINNGAPNFDARIRLLYIGHKSQQSSTQRQVWSSSCVGHLFPPIRFHFCCPAKLWNNRIGKWTCCCTTETFLSASLWVPVAFPSCFHVCWHTSLCWSVLVVLWYTSTAGLMMCACAHVSTTSFLSLIDLFWYLLNKFKCLQFQRALLSVSLSVMTNLCPDNSNILCVQYVWKNKTACFT